MRPIGLKGHARAITILKYNRDGDLLFSASKDTSPHVWFTKNGERLGTYEGHKGAVWALDVEPESRWLLTGAADQTVRLWEVESGKLLWWWQTRSTVRCVNFNSGATRFVTSTDSEMGHAAGLFIFELYENPNENKNKPLKMLCENGQKMNSALFDPFNEKIYACSDDSFVRVFDVETGKELQKIGDHQNKVNRLAFSPDQTMFITASSDYSAKLYDTRTCQLLKTYKVDKPLDAASIHPNKEYVIVGGGQEAGAVTTTAGQMGKFETHFFHQVYEQELGSIGGHFGPIHTLSFSPSGDGFASGAEDGFVRLHKFDADYDKQILSEGF